MKVLAVDDDYKSLHLLKVCLEYQGCDVLVAHNGLEALDVLSKNDIQLVVTDRMMPKMDGVTLCRKIRSLDVPCYIYIILLTVCDKENEIVEGMEAGADDYLTKPFNRDELRARVNAGKRVLNLEHSLLKKNEVIRKDLEAAREVQKSLLLNNLPIVPGIEFGAYFLPSVYVSGDIYSIFWLDKKHIGLYHVDVMGHGVVSSFFSLFISQQMNHDLSPYGLLKIPSDINPHYRINPPQEVAFLLNNENFIQKHGSYFTMLYGFFNIETGVISMYRAGHNFPLIIRANGDSQYIKGGGPPIGLGIPTEEKGVETVQLFKGDSFIVFSDGVNECFSAEQSDIIYGLRRVQDFLVTNRFLRMDEAFNRLITDVKTFQGKKEFDDDVSIIGLKWNGT